MSTTQVFNFTINTTEVQSVSDVASAIANRIQYLADKHGIGQQHDKKQTEEDMICFLVKRNVLDLETLEVHILEDGEIGVGSFTGRRLATLRFNIRYAGRGHTQ